MFEEWEFASDSDSGWTWDGETGGMWHAAKGARHGGADWKGMQPWEGGHVLELRMDLDRGSLVASMAKRNGEGVLGELRELGKSCSSALSALRV